LKGTSRKETLKTEKCEKHTEGEPNDRLKQKNVLENKGKVQETGVFLSLRRKLAFGREKRVNKEITNFVEEGGKTTDTKKTQRREGDKVSLTRGSPSKNGIFEEN